MQALLVEKAGQVAMVERPEPRAGHGQVLVRPRAVGICGSDLEILDGTRPEPYIRYPIVPGHEWAGEVVALAPGVSALREGDRVAVACHHYCGVCFQCRRGFTNLCERYDEFGFTRDGGMEELVAVRADLLHRFSPDLPYEHAALSEPLACAVNGVEMVAPEPGETVVVIGPGAIGLLGAGVFSLYRPRKLIVIGRRANNRAIAHQMGATDFVNTAEQDAVAEVERLTDGRGADIVYEAAGHEQTVPLALDLARRGGRVVYEGIVGGGKRVELESDLFCLKALHVSGVFAYTGRHFERALRLIESGLLDVTPLITHRFPLTDYSQAFAVLGDTQATAIKVVLLPS